MYMQEVGWIYCEEIKMVKWFGVGFVAMMAFRAGVDLVRYYHRR